MTAKQKTKQKRIPSSIALYARGGISDSIHHD
jgi:hypothetical protein